MAFSSILSIGLHLTIFLFFYYGLPFSKIKDQKETTIPLIFEEELEVSNKTNLKKNEKLKLDMAQGTAAVGQIELISSIKKAFSEKNINKIQRAMFWCVGWKCVRKYKVIGR